MTTVNTSTASMHMLLVNHDTFRDSEQRRSLNGGAWMRLGTDIIGREHMHGGV